MSRRFLQQMGRFIIFLWMQAEAIAMYLGGHPSVRLFSLVDPPWQAALAQAVALVAIGAMIEAMLTPPPATARADHDA